MSKCNYRLTSRVREITVVQVHVDKDGLEEESAVIARVKKHDFIILIVVVVQLIINALSPIQGHLGRFVATETSHLHLPRDRQYTEVHLKAHNRITLSLIDSDVRTRSHIDRVYSIAR